MTRRGVDGVHDAGLDDGGDSSYCVDDDEEGVGGGGGDVVVVVGGGDGGGVGRAGPWDGVRECAEVLRHRRKNR